MSSVKIRSKAEIKHRVAKLSRTIKIKTGYQAFNAVMQNNLLKLADIISAKNPNLRVSIFLYEDEYTFNHFVSPISWTAGVDENGEVNFCYLRNGSIVARGRFNINETVPNDFLETLDDFNDKIQ